MVFEFKLPDVGEGIHEAEVLGVKVKEGESVREYQPIFEVETDKAVVEITSPVSGVVEKIFVKVGDTARVGMVMITFAVSEEVKEAEPVRSVRADQGQPAEKTQPATVAAESRTAGSPVAAESRSASSPVAAEPRSSGSPVPAAPATRRLARELGVDIRLVHGSGPAGRVTDRDVRAYTSSAGVPFSAQAMPEKAARSQFAAAPALEAEASEGAAEPFSYGQTATAPFELPDFSRFGPIERVPLRSLRKRIAINMAQSYAHVPRVAQFDEIDITEIEAYRQKHEKYVFEKGGRLTLTVLALKALVSALKKYPQLNSSLDERTSEIIYKRYYNIGVAVATERGLIVPVIKDVDKKSVIDLSVELAEVAKKTREGKIELERLQGGTFTVTNIGAIGGIGMVPMVNYPEAAILGMARSKLQPVVRDGQIVIRNILNVALAFDHRVTDGAEAAYFVRHFAECLEDPFKLLLEA